MIKSYEIQLTDRFRLDRSFYTGSWILRVVVGQDAKGDLYMPMDLAEGGLTRRILKEWCSKYGMSYEEVKDKVVEAVRRGVPPHVDPKPEFSL